MAQKSKQLSDKYMPDTIYLTAEEGGVEGKAS